MDHQENEDASDDGPLVASKVFFAELCGRLEKISKTQGNDKKKGIMKEFIDKWGDFHNQLHNDNKKTVSITENVTKQYHFTVSPGAQALVSIHWKTNYQHIFI